MTFDLAKIKSKMPLIIKQPTKLGNLVSLSYLRQTYTTGNGEKRLVISKHQIVFNTLSFKLGSRPNTTHFQQPKPPNKCDVSCDSEVRIPAVEVKVDCGTHSSGK